MKNIKKVVFGVIMASVLSLFGNGVFADETKVYKSLLVVESSDEIYVECIEEEPESADEYNTSFLSLLAGKGTENSPYQISCLDDLLIFSDSINSGYDTTAYFKLTDDIDLKGKNWTPVGYYTSDLKYKNCFSGVFDGNGHTISNFKITNAERQYVGFFGFIYNGTVKNLTLSNFSLDVSSPIYTTLYAGGLAGRCISQYEGNKILIENCKVEDGSVYAQGIGNVYVGGFAGYIMSSTGSEGITVTKSHSSVSVEAYSDYSVDESAGYNVFAGGLIGYVGATVDTVLNIEYCSATEDVYSRTNLDSSSYRVGACAGGLLGYAGVSGESSKLNINGCYALGDAKTECTYPGNAGGFSSYFSVSSGALNVQNCYCLGNVSGKTISSSLGNDYICAGSFAGFVTSLTTLENCFATGNVKDTGSPDSYVGTFLGYEFLPSAQSPKVVIKNCYYPESIKTVGKNVTYTATLVKNESISSKESYIGFDFTDVWSILGNKYPSLKANAQSVYRVAFLKDGDVYKKYNSKLGEPLSMPQENPKDYMDEQKTHTFMHWSLTDGGQEFDGASIVISDNTDIYAVFDSVYRSFSIIFMNGDEIFDSQTLIYGSSVSVPENIPKRTGDMNFWYRFVRWSKSNDGSDMTDVGSIKVESDLVLYAIFEGLDHSVWDGVQTREFSAGAGTKSHPYEIRDGYELYYLSSEIQKGNTNLSTAHYKLCSDIDLGTNEWLPIGTEENAFAGVFDGKGYKIKNYILSSENKYVGLFGKVSGAEISSLCIENAVVSVADAQSDIYAGLVAGFSQNKNTIDKISISEECGISVKTSENAFVGAVVGCMSSNDGDNTVVNCSVHTNIDVESTGGNVYSGYISGYIYSENMGKASVSNCYALGSLLVKANKSAYAGGVLGMAYSTQGQDVINGSFVVGDVVAQSNGNCYVGYILGNENDYIVINNCYYYEQMKAEGYSVSGQTQLNTTGTATTTDNLRNSEFLIENLGFDFSSIWSLSQSYSYPVLKIIFSEKPIFTVDNVNEYAGSISLDVKVLSLDSTGYSVVMSVYSQRGRLIGIKTVKIEDNTTPVLNSFTITKDNMNYTDVDSVSYIKVTVIDNESLATLFPSYFIELLS